MTTAPPATKGKNPGNTAGRRLTPDGGVNASTTSPRQRRRPPLLVWGVAGAIAAGGYGYLVLAMRFGPPLVMVALGGLTLVLGAAALWRVVDPLTRAEVAAIPETRAPHRLRELEREKQTVLKAIKEIELDYQMRKISEADYREMVERYRARALRIMGDLAVGDDYRALIERELKDRISVRAAANVGIGTGTSASTGTGTSAAQIGAGAPLSTATCVACSTVNDIDAQFCKRCGQRLNPAAAPG